MFRNFLELVRKSEKYGDYKITLCGNSTWKNLSETFDRNFVDEFIWLDRKKFYFGFVYKLNFLKNIRQLGFNTVAVATHSREILFDDTIVNASNAKYRIGTSGSGEEFTKWKRSLLTNSFYTELIEISDKNSFEFKINQEFFRQLLGTEMTVTKPALDTSPLLNDERIKNKYVVLFPGSNDPLRIWSAKNFKVVADFILKETDFDIVISGSAKENKFFEMIASKTSAERFINLFGNSLTELAKLLAEAELLISNDTSAVHFAAAVDTPFICISNGSYFGRFNPYPESVYDKGIHIYPEEITKRISDKDYLKQKYRYSSDIDINKIKPQVVIEIIKTFLNSR
ncbi:MAG: glycosyltransferase family 9 protein [Ignavibacteriales bacterium]|nr:MAG: glycosyltransferase family 9 protein [Ignavibacteriales bacterium]